MPGDFAGRDELNTGAAFREPNFNAQTIRRRYDVVCEDIRAESDQYGWRGVLGLSINTGNTLAKDKSEMAVFFQHRLSGMWGAVCEARHWHLLGFQENNTKAHGQRMDELMLKSLRLAGLDANEINRRSFFRSCEFIMQTFFMVIFDGQLKDAVLEKLRASVGVWEMRRLADGTQVKHFRKGAVDSAPMRDVETGKPSGHWTEDVTGGITIDRGTAE